MEANEFYKRLEEAGSKINEIKDSLSERALKNLKDSIDELPKFFEEFYKEQENSKKKKDIEDSFEKILNNVDYYRNKQTYRLNAVKSIDFLSRVYELIKYLEQSLDKIYHDFPLKLELIGENRISDLIDDYFGQEILGLEDIIRMDNLIYRMLLNKENIFSIKNIINHFGIGYDNFDEILGLLSRQYIGIPFRKYLADYFVAIGEIDLVSYLIILYKGLAIESLEYEKSRELNNENNKRYLFLEEQLKAVEEWENENAFLFGKKKIQPTPLKQQ